MDRTRMRFRQGGFFMFGFVGAHFEVLVLVAFGSFAVVLGAASLRDALKR